MTLKQNSLEGQPDGTTVSNATSGGISGTAFDTGTAIGAGASLTFSTDVTPLHGSKTMKVVNPTGVTTFAQWSGSATASMACRFYVYFASLPGANGPIRLLDIRTSTTSVTRVLIDTSNRFILQTNNGTTTLKTFAAISAATWYRVDCATTNGTSTATIKMDYYAGDSLTPVEAGFTTSAGNTGVTTNITTANFGEGASPTATITFYLDSLALVDTTTTYVGPAPQASFSTSVAGNALTVNGSGSSATSPATISTYDWDWGDATGHGSGATPAAHTYSAGGTYTVVLTVTDSTGNKDVKVSNVTVGTSSGGVSPVSVDVATGWTPTGGTNLAVITDVDGSTYTSSSTNPVNQEFDITLDNLTPPTTNFPLKVFFLMRARTAVSATLNAQLYQGATQRSALTGVAIPFSSGFPITDVVTLTFPWSDVQNVTDWSALSVKCQVSAS